MHVKAKKIVKQQKYYKHTDFTNIKPNKPRQLILQWRYQAWKHLNTAQFYLHIKYTP